VSTGIKQARRGGGNSSDGAWQCREEVKCCADSGRRRDVHLIGVKQDSLWLVKN